jgi:hypothetical protein
VTLIASQASRNRPQAEGESIPPIVEPNAFLLRLSTIRHSVFRAGFAVPVVENQALREAAVQPDGAAGPSR